MLTVTLVGDKELVARLETFLGTGLKEVMRAKVQYLAGYLEAYVKTQKLSGQVLNRISSSLFRSIASEVIETDTAVIGRVFSSGDVKYAAILEYGGVIPPHDIYPKKAQALAFMMNGKQVFAKVVHHPGSTVKEYEYMRSSLRENVVMISLGLKEAMIKGLTNAVHEQGGVVS